MSFGNVWQCRLAMFGNALGVWKALGRTVWQCLAMFDKASGGLECFGMNFTRVYCLLNLLDHVMQVLELLHTNLFVGIASLLVLELPAHA